MADSIKKIDKGRTDDKRFDDRLSEKGLKILAVFDLGQKTLLL